MSETAATAPRTGAWRNVTLLAVSQGLAMTGNSLTLSTAALVGAALASNPSLATLPVALQFVATMATTIPASLFMGRYGRRFGFLLAAVVGLSAGALATLAILRGDYVLFTLAAILIGVFNGFSTYYRFAAVDVAGPAAAGRAVSMVLAGGLIAAFAGPNLASLTQGLVASAEFAGSYIALMVVYVLVFCVISFVRIPRPRAREHSGSGRPLSVIAAQPSFITAALGGMLGYGVMVLVMTATPLAMRADDFAFGSTAFVIQWHIVGMYAPSFVTGRLIARFGLVRIMSIGALLEAACVAVNLTGSGMAQYWGSLVLLGVGWNFLFVGATTLLTRTHTEAEKAKTQALNDFLIFSTVAMASLSAGALQESLGWQAVNLGVLPMVVVILGALLWLRGHGDRPVGAVGGKGTSAQGA
jgi:predicted MFS family arabinose efflux permease